MVSIMEEGKHFSVVRGDRFRQPFNITLSGGRGLTSGMTWAGTIRETKAGPVLASFASPTTIYVDPVTFQPAFEFFPGTLTEANFPIQDEPKRYFMDLEMTDAGDPETQWINYVYVVSDVTR